MSLISLVIPSRNEENYIEDTVNGIKSVFDNKGIEFEILVINDGSTDRTEEVVNRLHQTDRRIRVINNTPPNGFGNAINKGLSEFKGEYVIITMADSSDDPLDMLAFIEKVKSGYDCCFGQRWGKGAVVTNYSKIKYFLNRAVNGGISLLFGLRYTDATNAFKCYSRSAIQGIQPVLSHHFNITVELPLKAIVRGYSYAVVPTSWYNKRKKGESALKIQEMGSRYLFIILYVFLEKLLTGRDYKK